MRVYAVTNTNNLLIFTSKGKFEQSYSWIDKRLKKAVTHQELLGFYLEPYERPTGGISIIYTPDQIDIHNILHCEAVKHQKTIKQVNIALPTIYKNYLLYKDNYLLSRDDIHNIDEYIDIRGAEYDLFVCVGANDIGITSNHALYSQGIKGAQECSNFVFSVI